MCTRPQRGTFAPLADRCVRRVSSRERGAKHTTTGVPGPGQQQNQGPWVRGSPWQQDKVGAVATRRSRESPEAAHGGGAYLRRRVVGLQCDDAERLEGVGDLGRVVIVEHAAADAKVAPLPRAYLAACEAGPDRAASGSEPLEVGDSAAHEETTPEAIGLLVWRQRPLVDWFDWFGDRGHWLIGLETEAIG
eukprot:2033238-Prymnesium_polylepis.1